MTEVIKNSIKDPGNDNRNILEQLEERRRATTLNNMTYNKIQTTNNIDEINAIMEGGVKELGYEIEIKKCTQSTCDLNGSGGKAFIGENGELVVLLDINQTKSEYMGTLAEEISHVIGAKDDKQDKEVASTTDEKGLESLGRATNDYFEK